MDKVVLEWMNGYVAQSSTFDNFVRLIAHNPFVKGVPIAALFLFLWYLPRADQTDTRFRLISVLIVSVVAIVVGRMAALMLPYRTRPLHAETLDLQLPLSIPSTALDGWSSFPSDHAVLYAALATCFWMINRWAGLLAAVHALIVIAFARVYLTLHYPSDILGGAVIGLVLGLGLIIPVAALVRRAGILDMAERWPQYFVCAACIPLRFSECIC